MSRTFMPSLGRILSGMAIAVALFVSSARVALADRPTGTRFLFGASAGLGGVLVQTCPNSACDSGRGYARLSAPNLKLGWMPIEKLALLLTVPSGVHFGDGTVHTFGAIMPGVQYWFTSRFWLQAGIGMVIDGRGNDFHTGQGLSLTAGLDLLQRGNLVVDVAARVLWGHVEISDVRKQTAAGDILAGGTWHF